MSDTPTTAEEVITEAYQAWVVASLRPGIHDDWPAAVVAALRNSPDALADLNGGEWVQPNNGFHSAWWHDTEPSDEDPPSAVWRCEGFPVNAPPNDNPPPGYRPMFVFVPRKATNG